MLFQKSIYYLDRTGKINKIVFYSGTSCLIYKIVCFTKLGTFLFTGYQMVRTKEGTRVETNPQLVIKGVG